MAQGHFDDKRCLMCHTDYCILFHAKKKIVYHYLQMFSKREDECSIAWASDLGAQFRFKTH